MAEAKKREAKLKEQVKAIETNKRSDGMGHTGAATALQMLQSAYDDKR